MHFLLDVFQMTAIALVSVINHYHINGLHLFWDTLYICEGRLKSSSADQGALMDYEVYLSP